MHVHTNYTGEQLRKKQIVVLIKTQIDMIEKLQSFSPQLPLIGCRQTCQ